MSARDTIAAVLCNAPRADAVIDAIRAMSHDELRQLRPDIATLFDTARDTANTRGDYIINRLHDVETERDELAAKVTRVESLARWWHTYDDKDAIGFTAAAARLRETLAGDTQ